VIRSYHIGPDFKYVLNRQCAKVSRNFVPNMWAPYSVCIFRLALWCVGDRGCLLGRSYLVVSMVEIWLPWLISSCCDEKVGAIFGRARWAKIVLFLCVWKKYCREIGKKWNRPLEQIFKIWPLVYNMSSRSGWVRREQLPSEITLKWHTRLRMIVLG